MKIGINLALGGQMGLPGPSIPSGLTAVEGAVTVELSWTALPGGQTVNIYRSTSPGGEGSTPYATGVTGTTYSDTAVVSGTTYYYKITAVSGIQESAKTSEVSAASISNLKAWYKSDAGVLTDGAVHFTAASTQYMSKASVSLGLTLGTMTMEVWFKADTMVTNSYYTFMSFGGYISGGFIIQRAGDAGNNCFRLAYGATDSWDGPVFSTSGAWTQLIISVNATNVNFYVNGLKTAGTHSNGSSAFSAVDSKTLVLGRRQDNATQYVDGAMTQTRIWNRVLLDSEAAALYNNGLGLLYQNIPTATKVGLISSYDTINGANLGTDSVGANNLTLTNTPTLVAGLAGEGPPASGDIVTTWQDQSGNGNHLTQATATKRPQYIANVKNGLPGILGDGVGAYLKSATVSTISQPITIFTVYDPIAVSGYVFDGGTTVNQIVIRDRAGFYNLYAGADLDDGAAALNTWAIQTSIANGNSSSVQSNNNAAITGAAGANSLDGFTIGARSDGATAPFNGYVAEVMVYKGVLGATQITEVLNYLNNRYAIY